VDVSTRAPSYSELGFDHEHQCEGPVDLHGAQLERRFTDGDDRLDVWSFPPGATP
jgi:hypothetical protein